MSSIKCDLTKSTLFVGEGTFSNLERPSILEECSKKRNSKNRVSSKRKAKEYYLKNKEVLKEKQKKYREENKEKIRKSNIDYVLINQEKCREYPKEYRAKNKNSIQKYQKDYTNARNIELNLAKKEHYRTNYQEILAKQSISFQENKELKNEKQKKYAREREGGKDPAFKISGNLRRRLAHALPNSIAQKSKKTTDYTGYSSERLRDHIQEQFYYHPKTGIVMSWGNYGLDCAKWKLDHIIEFRSVDLTKQENIDNVMLCTNIQPLWYCDHKIKMSLNNK